MATDYPYPDFNLPARDYSFSNQLNGVEDFTLMDGTPWDSPFDLLLPPSNLAPPIPIINTNPILRNPFNAHLNLFYGLDDVVSSNSAGASGSTSQTDSKPVSEGQQPPYM